MESDTFVCEMMENLVNAIIDCKENNQMEW